MRRKILCAIVALLSLTSLSARSNRQLCSYNMQSALEAEENGNYEAEYHYLSNELDIDPCNGFAYAMLSDYYYNNNDNEGALECADLAIRLLPKRNNSWLSYSYTTMGHTFYKMHEYEKALNCYNKAIELIPDDENLYESRLNAYCCLYDYTKAYDDAKMVAKLAPHYAQGHYLMGWCCIKLHNYEEALQHLNYAIKLNENSAYYTCRAECYTALKQYHNAIDDIVVAIKKGDKNYSYKTIDLLTDSAQSALITRIKIESKKEPDEAHWDNLLGRIYDNASCNHKALEYFQSASKKNDCAFTRYNMALQYYYLGAYRLAIAESGKALSLDSTYYKAHYNRAISYAGLGDKQQALNEYDKYAKHFLENGDTYLYKGYIEMYILNDPERSIESFNTAIDLNPNQHAYYVYRAIAYHYSQKQELALANFQKAIELCDTTQPSYTICLAYAFMGQKEKASQHETKILENHKTTNAIFNASRLYAIMNEDETALQYLRQSLEMGFRNFEYFENHDFDNIRHLTTFKTLIDEYKAKHREELQELEPKGETYNEHLAEVPFQRENNVCKVQCSINGVPMNFIFDTGASTISISQLEASFLYKNGYIKDSDFKGSTYFRTADGSINEGAVVVLRKVEFAGLSLENIRASVVKNQHAPLLLGQSVLEKLGKIEIDNENRLLRITTKTPIKP